MTTKEKLIQELENLPDSLLLETLDFVCFLKAKYTQQNTPTEDQDNQDWLHLVAEQFFADYSEEDEIYNQI